MTQRFEVYECHLGGNVIEVLSASDGVLVCCGEPMELRAENTVDASREKHVPVIEKISGGTKVTVGSVAHPMEEDHYIEWIELIVSGNSFHHFLNPGDAPEAFFNVAASKMIVRSYCNLHGLWKA